MATDTKSQMTTTTSLSHKHTMKERTLCKSQNKPGVLGLTEHLEHSVIEILHSVLSECLNRFIITGHLNRSSQQYSDSPSLCHTQKTKHSTKTKQAKEYTDFDCSPC